MIALDCHPLITYYFKSITLNTKPNLTINPVPNPKRVYLKSAPCRVFFKLITAQLDLSLGFGLGLILVLICSIMTVNGLSYVVSIDLACKAVVVVET